MEQKDDLKLTKDNERLLLQDMDFKQLPRTVADAVTTTWRLGYQYLWVDRFCIIQDDNDLNDWTYEARRMEAYYMNSDCCIAALVPTIASEKMYVKRNPLLLQPLIFQNPSSGKSVRISARKIGAYGHFPQLYRGPPYALSDRAWVFQERLLAPRTLYFGSLMLYWECRQARYAEISPDIDLDLPWAKIGRKLGSRASASSAGSMDTISAPQSGEEDLWQVQDSDSGVDAFQERWADTVEFYTQCRMKYPEKDRLVAITGIINSVTQRTRQEFVHGMLKSRLASELLWWQWVRCKGDETVLPTRIGTSVKVPTWSWASVRGEIQPFWCHRYLLPQRRYPWAIEIDVTLEASEPSLLQGVTTVTHDAVCRINFTAPLIAVEIGKRLDMAHYCWTAQVVAQIGPDSYLTFETRMWPDEPVQPGTVVWMLRAASLQTDRVRLDGLLIAPAVSQSMHFWKRVGYWHSDSGVFMLETQPTESQRRTMQRTVELQGVYSVLLV